MLLTLALASAPMVTDVIDVGPGGAFTDIQPAVLAASEGDVIRVAPGSYSSFAILGKSLTIVPLATSFDVIGLIRIQNLAAGQVVALEGANIHPLISNYSEGRLVIGLNEGSVRIANVDARAAMTPSYSIRGPAVRAISCADLTFVDCSFGPLFGYDNLNNQYIGDGSVNLTDSKVAMISTTAVAAGTQTAAILCLGTELLAVDLTAIGSAGGDTWMSFGGNCRGYLHGGSPGIALDPMSTTTFIASTIVGGTEGQDGCYGVNYPAAPPIGGAGTVLTVAGPAVTFTAPHTVTENSVHVLALDADPTDTSMLVIGPAAARRDLPGQVGSLLVTGPRGAVRRQVLGMGSVSYSFSAPTLPSFGVEQVHLQAVHFRPNTATPGGREILFGTPRVVTVLDSAW